MDLDRYFQRIQYDGPTVPTLETLNGIVRAHTQAVPFENLDVLLGRAIQLDPEAIARKIIDDHRGGYCFEQNGYLLEVLLALGFHVTPISARVRLQRPREFTPARTHVFLRVEIEAHPWLADVGVGGLSPTCALRLEVGAEQSTPHEPRRIIHEDGRYFHQARLGDSWSDVCEFTGEAMPRIDREVANWYTCAHPQSHFKNRLLVARAAPDGARVTILNREFTQRDAHGRANTRTLESPTALLGVLDAYFGLRFPAGTEFPCEGLVWT